jgi:hypothetical protein
MPIAEIKCILAYTSFANMFNILTMTTPQQNTKLAQTVQKKELCQVTADPTFLTQ